jgi:hypothetical protein
MGVLAQLIASHVEQQVLAVPWGDAFIKPDVVAQAIEQVVSMGGKESLPVSWPLLIYVLLAALPRYCG